jgi:dTDP-4-amino-4,6-dideoxy-D-galactose acyltransferase
MFDLNKKLEIRKPIWSHYSSYSFLSFDNKVLEKSILDHILKLTESENVNKHHIEVDGQVHVFYLEYLKWDSDYFNIETYKLHLILFEHNNYNLLLSAVREFNSKYINFKGIHVITEIPSEDIWVIQALNECGFKLVETRLTYYLDLKKFDNDRFPVRFANEGDIPNLKKVASEMRNIYDRFHSDNIYEISKADNFLAKYIENSIGGFADCCIVPDINREFPEAFLTANYLKSEWQKIGMNISKMVLSAVSASNRKGWYYKLISEMALHLKSIGSEYVFMHPASTNRAVIHTYEKLGCKYGKCVQVLTKFSASIIK